MPNAQSMRTPRLVALLTLAAVIAACSAAGETPAPPATPTAVAIPAAPSAPAAPAAPAIALTPAQPAAGTTAPKTLKAAMKGIEDDWKGLEKALEAGANADLKAVAGAAQRIAAVMKLAYDPWEDKEVPNFGKLAHEAEDAFLELVKKAKAGDAAGVQELGRTLQPQHCARCHDAVEQVHG